jgi:hypothetical protein
MIPFRSSAEKGPTLLIILVFRAVIERIGKIGVAVVVLVTFICDVRAIIQTVISRSGTSFKSITCGFTAVIK